MTSANNNESNRNNDNDGRQRILPRNVSPESIIPNEDFIHDILGTDDTPAISSEAYTPRRTTVMLSD